MEMKKYGPGGGATKFFNVDPPLQPIRQYKLLCKFSNYIEVYEEPVPRTKKPSDAAVKLEVGEGDRIVFESFSLISL